MKKQFLPTLSYAGKRLSQKHPIENYEFKVSIVLQIEKELRIFDEDGAKAEETCSIRQHYSVLPVPTKRIRLVSERNSPFKGTFALIDDDGLKVGLQDNFEYVKRRQVL